MRLKFLLVLCLLINLIKPTNSYAWWGKYNSQIEAKRACDKWQANGIKFTRAWPNIVIYDELITLKHINRSYKHEA